MLKRRRRSPTENPEDEADLDFRDELVDRSERLFEHLFNLLPAHLHYTECIIHPIAYLLHLSEYLIFSQSAGFF